MECTSKVPKAPIIECGEPGEKGGKDDDSAECGEPGGKRDEKVENGNSAALVPNAPIMDEKEIFEYDLGRNFVFGDVEGIMTENINDAWRKYCDIPLPNLNYLTERQLFSVVTILGIIHDCREPVLQGTNILLIQRYEPNGFGGEDYYVYITKYFILGDDAFEYFAPSIQKEIEIMYKNS